MNEAESLAQSRALIAASRALIASSRVRLDRIEPPHPHHGPVFRPHRHRIGHGPIVRQARAKVWSWMH